MSFQETWSNADPDAAFEQGEPPAPGEYTVTIVDAKALTSKKQEDWVIVDLRDVVSEHEWPLVLGFKSETAAGFTKRACRTLGVDIASVGSLNELDTALKQAKGKYFTVEVKQNGEYVNTYLQGPAQGDVPVASEDFQPAGSTAVDDDDDIPF